MAIEKLEHESEIECSADKLYNLWKDDVHEIPIHIPHIIMSIEILEGQHGTDVAPIKFWHYEIDGKVINVKEQSFADDENKTITHIVLEGDVLNQYKSFTSIFSVTPRIVDGQENGSLAKWCLEYERKDENDPHPTNYIALVEQLTKDLSTEVHAKQAA